MNDQQQEAATPSVADPKPEQTAEGVASAARAEAVQSEILAARAQAIEGATTDAAAQESKDDVPAAPGADTGSPEPAVTQGAHPGHALIDEIQSNLRVQHKPSWIHEQLEKLRKLL